MWKRNKAQMIRHTMNKRNGNGNISLQQGQPKGPFRLLHLPKALINLLRQLMLQVFITKVEGQFQSQ